jgi:hypothetical protein
MGLAGDVARGRGRDRCAKPTHAWGLEGSKQKFDNTFDGELEEELEDSAGEQVDQAKFRLRFGIAQDAVHRRFSLLSDTLSWDGKFQGRVVPPTLKR